MIFEHSFLLSRSHRRILFDRISEVIVERTPVGTIFGYATVSILTDSGVGIVDESMGAAGAVNMPGTAENSDDTIGDKAKKSLLRSLVGTRRWYLFHWNGQDALGATYDDRPFLYLRTMRMVPPPMLHNILSGRS